MVLCFTINMFHIIPGITMARKADVITEIRRLCTNNHSETPMLEQCWRSMRTQQKMGHNGTCARYLATRHPKATGLKMLLHGTKKRYLTIFSANRLEKRSNHIIIVANKE